MCYIIKSVVNQLPDDFLLSSSGFPSLGGSLGGSSGGGLGFSGSELESFPLSTLNKFVDK